MLSLDAKNLRTPCACTMLGPGFPTKPHRVVALRFLPQLEHLHLQPHLPLQCRPQLYRPERGNAANPSLPASAVERFAREYIESGSSLPQVGIAGPGSVLIKVVPKGESVSPYSGYWMSPQQARAVSTMTPEQVGQLLGLPAAQAGSILKNGMDVYSITPKPGVTPNVFVSNVAGTAQGAVSMPGGAQQVIVPNRNLWTTPQPVNIVTLRP